MLGSSLFAVGNRGSPSPNRQPEVDLGPPGVTPFRPAPAGQASSAQKEMGPFRDPDGQTLEVAICRLRRFPMRPDGTVSRSKEKHGLLGLLGHRHEAAIVRYHVHAVRIVGECCPVLDLPVQNGRAIDFRNARDPALLRPHRPIVLRLLPTRHSAWWFARGHPDRRAAARMAQALAGPGGSCGASGP